VPAVLPMVRAICELHVQWDAQRFDIRPEVIDLYERWLPQRASDPESIFLVGETVEVDSKRLVAYLVATIEDSIPIYWTARCGWIHDTWVQPPFRRQGLARALVQEAVGRFKSMGITQIRGETAIANDASRAMLRSLGWRDGTIEMMTQQ